MPELQEEDEQRVEYSSSLLFGKPPLEAMEALKIRQTQLKYINHELAEWFTAYGRLRLQYVEQLNGLLKKGNTLFSDPSNPKLQNSKIDALGLATPMWSSVQQLVKKEAETMDSSTRKMGRDMIAPLKVFSRQNDSNLIEMDELVTLAASLAKEEAKGHDVSTLTNEWSQRAPYFFEIFERYDYNRLLLLKDVFLKYQTDLNDVLTGFKQENETALEHVLSFSPNDEIKRFSDAVVAKNLPLDNVKQVKHTSSAVAAAAASSNDQSSMVVAPKSPKTPSHRRSRILTLGSGNHKAPDSPSSHASKSRQSSVASSFTSSGFTNSDKKPKEKGKLRSRFGTMLRGRGKKNKSTDLSNSAIAESETSSLASGSATTNSASQADLRAGAGVRSYDSTPRPVSQQVQEPPKQSAPESVPVSAVSAAPVTQSPPTVSSNSHAAAAFAGNPVPSYPAMQPTKRSNSVASDATSNSSIQPSASSHNYQHTAPTTAPISETPAEYEGYRSSLQPKSAKPAYPAVSQPVAVAVPAPTQNASAAAAAAPPPPPSSRKHVSTDLSSLSVRQPHGSAPAPPQQRRSMSQESGFVSAVPAPAAASSSSLAPQGTGSTLLSRNTTGNGGLMSGQIHHPSLTKPGLNASIVEIFNATFRDGVAVRSNVIGEVAFSYILDQNPGKIPRKVELAMRANNGTLPNFMCNTQFIRQNTQYQGSFTIVDPSQIYLRTVGGLKYMLNDSKPPIVVLPIWKHEQTQSTVIISIKPAEELLALLGSASLQLSDLMVSVSITGSQANSAATKPSGSFNKEKNRVTWNLVSEPLVFSQSHAEERLIARFMTNGIAREADAGVQLRYTITSETGASIVGELNNDLEILALAENEQDPFSSSENVEDEWSEIPTLKTIIAGSYSGHV